MHFLIATYLILRTLSLAMISELFVTFQLFVSVFYAVFYAMTSAMIMVSRNFTPIDLKLGI